MTARRWIESEWVRDRRGRLVRRRLPRRDPYVTTPGMDKNWRNRSRAGLASEPKRRAIKTTRVTRKPRRR